MKLRKISVENIRSFLDPRELELGGDITILVGPNGGGKTNLLDTITSTFRTVLLRPYTLGIEGSPPRPTLKGPDEFAADAFERYSGAPPNREQRVAVEIEVTAQDIKTMATLLGMVRELETFVTANEYRGFDVSHLKNIKLEMFKSGDRLSYTVVNRSIPSVNSDAAAVFLSYLQNFEAMSMLKAQIDHEPLALPFAYFPVNRALNDIPSSIAVASFNEADSKRGVDRTWSRQVASIQQLALGRIFKQKRYSIEPEGSVFHVKYDADGSLARLGETLQSLGYDWRIDTTNPQTNEYELRLLKGGADFNVSRASSGEKELITYVLAVYGLNLRDALIVVDEPELHLHPKWQKALLDLFQRLAADTGNQFVAATHSPAFISPRSISYVSRVYAREKQSQITKLSDEKLPNQKHLLSIVNSQNNEKIFFADRVILVEGISDRIFFERLMAKFSGAARKDFLIEIVSVGGKSIFSQYASLLEACGVEHRRVADLDYVAELDPQIDKLFRPSEKGIKQAVVDADTNLDGAAIVAAIEESISSGDTAKLLPIWEYVKGRRRRLRNDLSPEEQSQLDQFIGQQAQEGIFVLSKGALEAYLPEGFAGKDLEKLIEFLADPTFWERLPKDCLEELERITASLIS